MTFDVVNRAAVVLSTSLLAAGLAAWLLGPRVVAARLLDAGLLALMLTPVLRLVTTLADDVRRRDRVAAVTPVLRLVTTLADDVRRRDRVAAVTTLAVVAILAVSLTLALSR